MHIARQAKGLQPEEEFRLEESSEFEKQIGFKIKVF